MPAPQVQTGVYASTNHNALASYVDDMFANNPGGQIIKSWKTTPSILGFTAETDVLSNSWTPTLTGCYRLEATVPFDGSAAATDCKARLLVGATEVDLKIDQTPGGVFVDKIHMFGTIDITSLSAVTVKTTVQRTSGAATCNSRLAEARIEVFFAGSVGVRA